MQNKDSLTNSVLPPELLEEIYKRLVPNDRIRFSSVCKAWLSAVISVKPRCRPPVPEPWLMLCHRNHGTYLQNCKFHCLSDKRDYKFNNVVPINYKVVTMSSDGWVLTISPLYSHLQLVNLMSNTQIRIIPLGLCWFDIKNIKKLFVLERRPTSSSESIYNTNFDLIMLAPVSAQLNIVLCTNNKFHRLGFMGYNDILLYKGELYALRIIRGTCFGIHVFDQEQIYRIYLIRGIAPNSNKDEVYLVESGGDLLLVRRQPNDLLQTAGFDVFKLTTEEYECWYLNAVKLQSLGNHQALFWGRQGCFSVPVEESSPFEEDHIYFIHVLEENRLTEYGVYSLKDGSIKQVPNLNVPGPPSASAESFWFFPTVKDTTVYPKRKLKVD